MIPTYSSPKDNMSDQYESLNLGTDSGRKWSLESESKSEIERKHLHHREMSKLVN